MKRLNNIIAVLFIIYGAAGVIGVAYLYYAGLAECLFSGINIYKVPANIIGGLAAMIGGVKVINRNNTALWHIGFSILCYLIGATYEIVLKYGIYFYDNIMVDFFWAAGIQIALFLILIFGSSRRGYPHKKRDAD